MEERTEVRVPKGSALNVRQAGSGSPGTLEGLAAVIGEESHPIPDDDGRPFIEVIEPGAFDETDLRDVAVLFNHDQSQILGRNSAGTAFVDATDQGLAFATDLPDSPVGRTVGEAVDRGDVTDSSFGFVVAEGGARWERRSDGTRVRHLEDIEIVRDVGPVVFAAYPQTAVQARKELRAFERAGCPDGWRWNADKGACERVCGATERRLLDARLERAREDVKRLSPDPDAARLGYGPAAAHEAGHLVMARHLDLDFDRAVVCGRRGAVRFKGEATDRERALFYVAGEVAERLLGAADYGGKRSDRSKLESACRKMASPGRPTRHHSDRKQVRQLGEEIEREAYRILSRRRDHVARVARRLERDGQLDSTDFVA